MNLIFYRCDACHRLTEQRIVFRTGRCRCGGRRINSVRLSWLELYWFILWHPSYLVQALRGE